MARHGSGCRARQPQAQLRGSNPSVPAPFLASALPQPLGVPRGAPRGALRGAAGSGWRSRWRGAGCSLTRAPRAPAGSPQAATAPGWGRVRGFEALLEALGAGVNWDNYTAPHLNATSTHTHTSLCHLSTTLNYTQIRLLYHLNATSNYTQIHLLHHPNTTSNYTQIHLFSTQALSALEAPRTTRPSMPRAGGRLQLPAPPAAPVALAGSGRPGGGAPAGLGALRASGPPVGAGPRCPLPFTPFLLPHPPLTAAFCFAGPSAAPGGAAAAASSPR